MRRNIWNNKNISTGGSTSSSGLVSTRTIPVELKPDAINKEGFSAFSMSIEEEVLQALMTGSLANLYYSNAKENTKNFIDIFNKIENTTLLAQSIVYAREKGLTRTIPISASVVLSKRDVVNFKKIAHKVMRNPHDWKQFIDICRSKEIRNGIGRAPKREINAAMSKLSSYYALKYPSDLKDMINIARPNEKINPHVINYIKHGLDYESKNGYGNVLDDEMLKAVKNLTNVADITFGDNDVLAATIIRESKLPYEFVTGLIKKPSLRIWNALLHNAPYFNLIRNLNTFGRNGLFNEFANVNYAVEKIINPYEIKKSNLFPFRFYTAWRTIDDFNGSNEIKNALLKALEISVVNIPEITESVCIAPDISGSMSSNVIENEDKSSLRCIDLVGLFTGIIKQKAKNSVALSILPFNNDVDLDLSKRIMSKETIFEVAKEFKSDGGTSLSAPVEFLLKNNIKTSRIIAFTDQEEWVGSSFIDSFYDYKMRISPECKAYLVKLVPSRTNATPPNITDVFFIYGWNENVLRYVTSDLESQMDEVIKVIL